MTNRTDLTYEGVVSLKLIINDKVIELTSHNSGLEFLSKTFASYITGNNKNTYDIPQYLDLQRAPKTTGAYNTYLVSLVSLSAKTIVKDTNQPVWYGKVTGVLPYKVLSAPIREEDDSSYYFRFQLYSLAEDGTRYNFAVLSAEANDLSKIIPGTQAIVEWSLGITNTVSD